MTRYKKREEATKRLTLWRAGRRRGVNRIQEWAWLRHPGREQKFQKKKIYIYSKDDKKRRSDKKDNRSITATNTAMLRCKGRKHNSGWSTMVIPPPRSSIEIDPSHLPHPSLTYPHFNAALRQKVSNHRCG